MFEHVQQGRNEDNSRTIQELRITAKVPRCLLSWVSRNTENATKACGNSEINICQKHSEVFIHSWKCYIKQR